MNQKVKFTYNLEKPDGNSRKLMDSSLARTYGWNPPTNIVEGLKKTIDWYQDSKND